MFIAPPWQTAETGKPPSGRGKQEVIDFCLRPQIVDRPEERACIPKKRRSVSVPPGQGPRKYTAPEPLHSNLCYVFS